MAITWILKEWKTMNLRFLPFAAAAFLTLGGCQTLDTLGAMLEPKTVQTADVQSDAQAQTLNASILAAAGTESCPPIRIMQDLKQLVQFENAGAPDPDKKLSEIEIESVSGSCSAEEQALALKIDITFDGAVAAKGRAKGQSAANFSYPYFVAVTDEDGKILAKEIFAASLTYSPGQDTIKQIETINQLLPKAADAGEYTVLLGFQLNADQLEYNRTQLEPAAGDAQPSDATVNIE